MRIALFSDGIFPNVIGGIQKHSFYLAKHLVKLGIEVDVYFSEDTQATTSGRYSVLGCVEDEKLNWIPVKRAPQRNFPGHYLWDSYVTSASLLQAYLHHRTADFIYAQGLTGWSAVRARCNGSDLSLIGVNPHGLEIFQRAADARALLENWMLRPAFGWLIRHADVALSLGGGGLAEIMKRLGVKAERIIESPNGVGRHWLVSHVNVTTGPLRFVFIGRSERRKGVKELNVVLSRLLDRYEFTCDFVGPTPASQRLSHPAITYWGVVREERRVQEILRSCHVLLCPSYSEGMPTVILEAMASGLAIIATKVGAVDAMVSKESGWLIPPGDVESLERSMVEAIALPKADISERGLVGRRRVESMYTWDRVAERTEHNIASMVGPGQT